MPLCPQLKHASVSIHWHCIDAVPHRLQVVIVSKPLMSGEGAASHDRLGPIVSSVCHQPLAYSPWTNPKASSGSPLLVDRPLAPPQQQPEWTAWNRRQAAAAEPTSETCCHDRRQPTGSHAVANSPSADLRVRSPRPPAKADTPRSRLTKRRVVTRPRFRVETLDTRMP
jgi:hypothetical protein